MYMRHKGMYLFKEAINIFLEVLYAYKSPSARKCIGSLEFQGTYTVAEEDQDCFFFLVLVLVLKFQFSSFFPITLSIGFSGDLDITGRLFCPTTSQHVAHPLANAHQLQVLKSAGVLTCLMVSRCTYMQLCGLILVQFLDFYAISDVIFDIDGTSTSILVVAQLPSCSCSPPITSCYAPSHFPV